MDPAVALPAAPAKPSDADVEPDTGLPWPCSWRGVYVFVFGSFVLWVALLYALTLAYS